MTLIYINNTESLKSKSYSKMLVYSNLIYLLPIIILIYKFFWQKSIDLIGFLILGIFYLATMLYSINYHICQGRSAQVSSDFPYLSIVAKCAKDGMLYTQAQFNDLVLANYTVFLTLLYIMPINNELRIVLQSIVILWIITAQSFSNVFNNSIFLAIPTVLVAIFYFIYQVVTFRHLHIFSQILTGFGCIFAAVAMGLFLFPGDKYELLHGLWHIFGGLGGSCILFPAVIGKDKFTWRGLFHLSPREPTLLDKNL